MIISERPKMNQRFSELKQQAHDYAVDQEWYIDSFEQRFAELIVSECVGVADDYVKDCLCEEHIKCNHPRSKIGMKIKQHFGV